MRFPVAVAASVFSIALYFALSWGFDAVRILLSPSLGLEDAWRSQIVYWIGRVLGVGPQGLLHLAAAAATLKLTAAGVCAAHIVDRIRCFKAGKPDAEIIVIGLSLVIIVSILSVLPAIWQQDAALVRTNTLNLILASIAASLSLIERSEAIPAVSQVQVGGRLATAIADAEPVRVRAAWYSPWR